MSPPQPSPKLPFLHVIPFALVVIAAVLGNSPAKGEAGPKFIAGKTHWQSLDLDWIELDGKQAVNMTVAATRLQDGASRYTINEDLLMAICGGFLSGSSANFTERQHRKNIYRIGIQFLLNDLEEKSRMYPVAVIDGACSIMFQKKQVFWNYPNKLLGWSPIDFTEEKNETRAGLTMIFQKVGQGPVGLNEFDPLLACNALFTDMPPNLAPVLQDLQDINIRASSKVGGTLINARFFKTWEMLVDGSSCSYKGSD